MSSVKKIYLSFIALPLLFILGSFLLVQKANAVLSQTCSSSITISDPIGISKQQTQTSYNLKILNSSVSDCTFIPFVSKGANVVNWNFSFNTSSFSVPAKGTKTITVTAKPPISWLNDPSNNGFRVRLKYPDDTQISAYNDIDYPASYAPNCKTNPTLSNTGIDNNKNSITYSMSLKNNDGKGCYPTSYNLFIKKPSSNWTTEVQNSIGGNISFPISRSPGQILNFKIKVAAPGTATENTNPGYRINVAATGDSLSDSVSLIFPVNKPEPVTKTFRFTGYVFIDNNSDGIRQSTEKCYNGGINVRIGGVGEDNKQTNFSSSANCNTYTLSTTSTQDKVMLSIAVPSNHNATKLNFRFTHLGETTTQTANGSSREFTNSNNVNFGIKPNSDSETTKTRDLTITAFNFPGDIDSGSSDPTVTIKNIGNTEISGDFKVKVENKQNGTGTSQVWNVTQVVSAGESISRTFSNFPRPSAGNYTAKVTVDSGKEITESNEDNNTETDSYTTTNSNGGSGGVTSPAPTCDKNRPTLDVTPNSRSGKAGDKKEFTIEIKNNDSSNCDTSIFEISKIGIDGWESNLNNNSLEIAPGNTKSTLMTVTSSTEANQGPNTMTVSIQRANGPIISENITFDILEPEITPIISQDVTNPSNSPTDIPNLSPIPSISQGPLETKLNLVIGIDGIGTTTRIPIGGNQNPDHPNRNLTIRMYNASNNTPANKFDDYTLTFNPQTYKFEGTLNFDDSFQSGIYNIFVEGKGVLRSQIPGSVTLTRGMTKTAQTLDLISGDINKVDRSNNNIDLNDYNILVSCSIYSQDRTACEQDPDYERYSDLDDNGVIDEDDFTLWLKEVANQGGAQLPQ